MLLQLSVDYLVRPLEVVRQVGRVLRPGGALLVTFSNRVFIDKAVAAWTGKSDLDHISTVGSYVACSRATLPSARCQYDKNLQTPHTCTCCA